jgi:hypothetical protein
MYLCNKVFCSVDLKKNNEIFKNGCFARSVPVQVLGIYHATSRGQSPGPLAVSSGLPLLPGRVKSTLNYFIEIVMIYIRVKFPETGISPVVEHV